VLVSGSGTEQEGAGGTVRSAPGAWGAWRIAVDAAGDVYVPGAGDAKSGAWFARRIGPNGVTRNTVPAAARRGSDEGELANWYPGSVSVDAAGHVWLTETTRIQQFTREGLFIRSCSNGAVDLDASPDGSLYLAGGKQIVRLADVRPPGVSCLPPQWSMSGPTVSPHRLRPARAPSYRRRGATITYRLSHPATVDLFVTRLLHGGGELRKLVSQSPQGHAGMNLVRLSGWYFPSPGSPPRPLRPGRYRLRAVASAFGQHRHSSTTFVVAS
jgi:hypothetical protein